MSHGFIKLYRETAAELLAGDPKSYLLLSQIAIRARRKDSEYSRISLKANQAFIGDHENIGLSRQEYRTARKKLKAYGLVTFKPTNKGTIATMTSTSIFDINAEEHLSLEQPPISSMKNQNHQPTNNQPSTTNKPANLQREADKEPLTRKEERKEYKKATTTASDGVVLYKCLQQIPNLSLEEKTGLMKYPEDRVEKAIEWASKTKIKKSLIQTIHWHCRQLSPPLPQQTPLAQNEQQAAAWEYNLFLKQHDRAPIASENETAIPKQFTYVILDGQKTTISLRNPIEIVKADFTKSMNEIITQQGVQK